MANLFKKAIVFTDLHLGLKNNSILHNTDCEQFVDWVISEGQKAGCDTCISMGDWHNNRASINLQTLHYSVAALERLSAAFSQVFFIPGNHDLYYRDKRDIHGASWAKHIPNITLVNDWFSEGGVVIAPWLVHDDHKKISKQRGQYMFGHFELPSFMMNAQVEMPDTGEIRLDDFKSFETVFSGHFHIRQKKHNIHYIGNAFPHNYGDAGDDARGAMILEWGLAPSFISWPNQPTYRSFKLSQILNDETLMRPNQHCKVQIDIDISYEEAQFIKDAYITKYALREMSLIPIKANAVGVGPDTEQFKFENVNQIVSHQLSAIKSEFYDTPLLLSIYNNL